MRIKPTDELPVSPDGQERRSVRQTLEFREADEGASISGYAAMFNDETVIGGGPWGFREVILPGAFDEAIKADDVRALFNHNPDILLGRTESKTLRLKADKKGLHYDVDLPDTAAAKDVRTLIKRGDVSGSSFAFRVEQDDDEQWDYSEVKNGRLPLRKIVRARLYDVSPVTYPAYPSTSVSARSKALQQPNGETHDAESAGITVVLQMDGREIARQIAPALPDAVADLRLVAKADEPVSPLADAKRRIALARAKAV